jgi:hypothetical protein
MTAILQRFTLGFDLREPRHLRWLVAWWLCSLIVLAVLVCHYVLPVDTEFEIVSPAGPLAVAAISFGWSIPGYASGGWKALLVAADRSQVRTRTDTIFVGAFAVWAVGWPLFVVAMLLLG